MTKTFSRLQLFSIVDGRLSVTMGEVYEMFNHICDTDLMTHHLPVAGDYLKLKNPQWLQDEKLALEEIKAVLDTDDFKVLHKFIDEHNEQIEIPQLKDEFDTSDFSGFMVNNSLLLKKFA